MWTWRVIGVMRTARFHLNRPIRRFIGLTDGSDPVRLVAGFRKGIESDTWPIDGSTCWTNRSDLIFKTLVLSLQPLSSSLFYFFIYFFLTSPFILFMLVNLYSNYL